MSQGAESTCTSGAIQNLNKATDNSDEDNQFTIPTIYGQLGEEQVFPKDDKSAVGVEVSEYQRACGHTGN